MQTVDRAGQWWLKVGSDGRYSRLPKVSGNFPHTKRTRFGLKLLISTVINYHQPPGPPSTAINCCQLLSLPVHCLSTAVNFYLTTRNKAPAAPPVRPTTHS